MDVPRPKHFLAVAFLACLTLLTLTSPAMAQSDGCDRAREMDGRARSLEPAAVRVAAYQEITALCATFNYTYMLGRAQQESGDMAAAKHSYNKARALVGDTRAEGLLYGRLAQVHLALNQAAEAVAIADVALALTQPNTPDWVQEARRQADLALADQPITAERITQGLATSRSFGVRPRIHLHILFDAGKDSLTKTGRAQVLELGMALAGLLEQDAIQLVGHTDIVGFEFYNQRLSVMRAERVMDEVIAANPKLANRITAVGRGDKAPRYTDSSDGSNRLNRRVEVVLGAR